MTHQEQKELNNLINIQMNANIIMSKREYFRMKELEEKQTIKIKN